MGKRRNNKQNSSFEQEEPQLQEEEVQEEEEEVQECMAEEPAPAAPEEPVVLEEEAEELVEPVKKSSPMAQPSEPSAVVLEEDDLPTSYNQAKLVESVSPSTTSEDISTAESMLPSWATTILHLVSLFVFIAAFNLWRRGGKRVYHALEQPASRMYERVHGAEYYELAKGRSLQMYEKYMPMVKRLDEEYLKNRGAALVPEVTRTVVQAYYVASE